MKESGDGLEGVIEALRRGSAPRPAAFDRLRAALASEARGRGPGRAIRRLASVPAVAAASTLLALGAVAWAVAARGSPEGAGAAPVQFVLHAPDARSVALVGDFNDWDPAAHPLAETGRGVWSVVVSLRSGAVRYSFLVDGREWRADPDAAAAPSDFGRPSSLAWVDVAGET